MQRTIRIHLHPSARQAAALAETSRQFTAAFNLFTRLGWDADVCNATKLHYLAYYAVRGALPDLNSNLTNTARAKAAEALRSAFTLRTDKGRTVRMPQSDTCPPRYNVHTYRVDWESQTVRMSLVGQRSTTTHRSMLAIRWILPSCLNVMAAGGYTSLSPFRRPRCNRPIRWSVSIWA